MDAIHFDDWVRGLRSRRSAMRTLAGLSAAFIGPRAVAADPTVCLANGAKCHPTNAAACCTGTCKKRKGKFTCVPAGQAFGCTKQLDECIDNRQTPCPHNPTGTACIGGEKSKPL